MLHTPKGSKVAGVAELNLAKYPNQELKSIFEKMSILINFYREKRSPDIQEMCRP